MLQETQSVEDTQTLDGNVEVVNRVVSEVWNSGFTAVADQLFAPEYVNHGGLIPDLVGGPEAVKVSVVLYRLAFPSLHIAIEDLVATGDTVVLQWTASQASRTAVTGTEWGWSFRGTTRSRLTAGRIVESWTSWDGNGAVPRWRRKASTACGSAMTEAVPSFDLRTIDGPKGKRRIGAVTRPA
jgi:hypothetical protein